MALFNRHRAFDLCGIVMCVIVLGITLGCSSSEVLEKQQSAEQNALKAIVDSGGRVSAVESVARSEKPDYLPACLTRDQHTIAYKVELSEPQITDENLKRLSEVPHLKRLVLKTSKIDGHLAKRLKRLRNLKSLTIRSAEVSDDAIADLAASLPNTSIIR